MADNKVTFLMGRNASTTSPSLKAGQFIFDSDTGNAFVDISADTRVQLKDDTKLPLSGGRMSGSLTVGGPSSSKAVILSSSGLSSGTGLSLSNYGKITVYNSQGPNVPGMITNLATPTSDTDAANKAYVDAAIAGISSETGSYLPLSGGTMTGDIAFSNGGILKSVTGAGSVVDFQLGSTRGFGGKITFLTPKFSDGLCYLYDSGGNSSAAGLYMNQHQITDVDTITANTIYGTVDNDGLLLQAATSNQAYTNTKLFLSDNSVGTWSSTGLFTSKTLDAGNVIPNCSDIENYVSQRFNDIQSNTSQRFTPLTDVNSANNVTFYEYKYGKMVTLVVNGSMDFGERSSFYQVGTLNTAYRPQITTVVEVPGFSGPNVAGYWRVRIGTDGSIQITSSASGMKELMTTITYATN